MGERDVFKKKKKNAKAVRGNAALPSTEHDPFKWMHTVLSQWCGLLGVKTGGEGNLQPLHQPSNAF